MKQVLSDYMISVETSLREEIDNYKNINPYIKSFVNLSDDVIREFADHIDWDDTNLIKIFEGKDQKLRDEFKKYLIPLKEKLLKKLENELNWQNELIDMILDD